MEVHHLVDFLQLNVLTIYSSPPTSSLHYKGPTWLSSYGNQTTSIFTVHASHHHIEEKLLCPVGTCPVGPQLNFKFDGGVKKEDS